MFVYKRNIAVIRTNRKYTGAVPLMGGEAWGGEGGGGDEKKGKGGGGEKMGDASTKGMGNSYSCYLDIRKGGHSCPLYWVSIYQYNNITQCSSLVSKY